MSDFPLTSLEKNQLALLHAHLLAGGGIAPFARDIFLIETHVAGTSHLPIRDIEPRLNPGDTLLLRRETGNPHDPFAILILAGQGEKIGYVPRDRNEILSRLLDAGKFIFARLESKQWRDNWLFITARVFLKDN